MTTSFQVIINPIRRLATQKPNASLLLFLATVVAMFLANCPLADSYLHMLDYPINFHIGSYDVFAHHGIPMTLLEFVNDALMAVFFFLIGLEIKQEVLIGDLSSFRKALLPVVAACGGMIVPVLVFLLICNQQPEMRGAAIPMATDIAFALAVIGTLGKRIPLSLRIFLTALAVVDDIGGIIIIALFYSSHIAFEMLLISFVILGILYLFGRMHINNCFIYYLGGFVVWMLFLESGIHPTIAGVLVAFTVPASPKIHLEQFTEEMVEHLQLLDYAEVKKAKDVSVLSNSQIHILNSIHVLANRSISPLQRIADKLHPIVYYFILPLFAFVNAGVTFGSIEPSSLIGIPLAIFLGLFIGKTLGIFLFTYLFIRMRIVMMPPGMTRKNLFGVAMLGGIGFTVALFIANLSYAPLPEIGMDLLNQAKLGVFAGSVVSGLGGWLFLYKTQPKLNK